MSLVDAIVDCLSKQIVAFVAEIASPATVGGTLARVLLGYLVVSRAEVYALRGIVRLLESVQRTP